MLAKLWKKRIARISLVGLITLFLTAGGTWFTSMKANSEQPAVNCQGVVPGKLYRYVEGLDPCLTPMSNSEIEKLTDAFATGVLRKGIFPDGVTAMDQAIKSNLGYEPTAYFVGEGSQIPTTVVSREDPRSLRALITWGPHQAVGKIMVSKLAPTTKVSLTEVMSFDDRTKKYNYYFLTNQVGAKDDSPLVWAWVGNSSLARQPKTIGQGCFRCHHNGVPIMRELESPWNNWQSQRANISGAVLPKEVASDSYSASRWYSYRLK